MRITIKTTKDDHVVDDVTIHSDTMLLDIHNVSTTTYVLESNYPFTLDYITIADIADKLGVKQHEIKEFHFVQSSRIPKWKLDRKSEKE